MTALFDRIRPYRDDEVKEVLNRLKRDREFVYVMIRLKWPKAPTWFCQWMMPLVSHRIDHLLEPIVTVENLQEQIGKLIQKCVAKTCDDFTSSGLEQLTPNQPYLFIANHRDIVMDPALVLYAMRQAHYKTPRIAIGDNLLQKPFISDLMRLNKSFIVFRSLKSRREKWEALNELSQYIHHSLDVDKESIWIAQSEGRTKDGNDTTDAAILKMLHISKSEFSLSQALSSVCIVPVSISYEFDPGDVLKAKEMCVRSRTGDYQKVAGEDDRSIAQGIMGYKGRVHIGFSAPLTQPLTDARQTASEMDAIILEHYQLRPVHWMAYQMWEQGKPSIKVNQSIQKTAVNEVKRAQAYLQSRLDMCSDAEKPFLIQQYAYPVFNKLKKNGEEGH